MVIGSLTWFHQSSQHVSMIDREFNGYPIIWRPRLSMKQGNRFLALKPFGIVDYTYIILHFCQQPCGLHKSNKKIPNCTFQYYS